VTRRRAAISAGVFVASVITGALLSLRAEARLRDRVRALDGITRPIGEAR
jgi:hypothetical protein